MTLTDEVAENQELTRALAFFEHIPFNKLLGLKPLSLSDDCCKFSMSMKNDLVGNWVRGILHGGAISTALDVTGGAMAFIAAYRRMDKLGIPMAEKRKAMSRMGTIDMRVDFLQPGLGKEFVASATLLRVGSKVA